MTGYALLLLAILLEVSGTTSMKLSQGFTRTLPSVLLFVFYAASFTTLTFALERLEVSLAYAIWSGLGTAIIALIGYFWFQEGMSALKIASLALIILGVIGLNLGGQARG